ncbi:MAG: hypothetical protein RLZZ188_485 [Verrucomicrobiota bacterium]|jgi:transcriptional regulator with XRE-family HTH domain
MKHRRRAGSAGEPWGNEKMALEAARDAVRTPAGGWIRAVREWRGTRQKDLAAQLGTQRQAWAQLELSEQRDAISLYSLRKAARALGCDVVYYLVPREAAGENPVSEQAPADSVSAPPVQAAVNAAARVNAPASGWFAEELRTELL